MRAQVRPLDFCLASTIAFAIAVTQSVAQPTSRPSTQPAEMTASSNKQVYYPGDPVKLTIVTRNLSNRGTVMVNPESMFRFAVFRDGKEVQPTEWAKHAVKAAAENGLARHGATIYENQSISQTALLSRWVDMSMSGKYEVVVSRMVGEVGDRTGFSRLIESNRLRFEIKE